MNRLLGQGKETRYWIGLVAITGIVLLIFFLSLRKALGESCLTVQIARRPSCLDPARMYSFEEKLIDGALYECLLKYDREKGRFVGELAEKWSSDGSGRVYTFTLRSGVRFHDGSRITAWDVKYSWERVLNPKICDYGYLLQNVVGARERLDGLSREVPGIEVVNDDTLKVTLLETDWTFPAVASSPALAVVNRRVVEDAGSRYGEPGTRVVGSGPFRLDKWEKERILLRRNPFFGRPRPLLNSLSFRLISDQHLTRRLFEKGELDVLAGVPGWFTLSESEEDRPSAGCKVFSKPILSTYFLGFNLKQGPFRDNPELRRGIDRAIDRGQIEEMLLGEGGKTLNGFLPPELLPTGRSGGLNGFSTDEALKSLERAGYPYGLHLPSLIYAYNDSPGHEATARLIQEQLGKIGLDVQLKKISWNSYRAEIRKGTAHIFRLGWEADYPEAGNLLFNLFSGEEKGGSNYTGYSSLVFEQLLRQARSEPDPTRRAEIYAAADRMLAADLPVIPLFQKVAFFYLQKNVNGFNIDLLGRVDFLRISKGGRRQGL